MTGVDSRRRVRRRRHRKRSKRRKNKRNKGENKRKVGGIGRVRIDREGEEQEGMGGNKIKRRRKRRW